jgi:hypothetical protein
MKFSNAAQEPMRRTRVVLCRVRIEQAVVADWDSKNAEAQWPRNDSRARLNFEWISSSGLSPDGDRGGGLENPD